MLSQKDICHYCTQDAIFTSTDEEGFVIVTCRAHFKYMYVG